MQGPSLFLHALKYPAGSLQFISHGPTLQTAEINDLKKIKHSIEDNYLKLK